MKNEAERFGLNAFKAMGGLYAIGKHLAALLGKEISEVSLAELQSKQFIDEVGQITFITATDGNHGRGVAWAAKTVGQKAIVYLPKGASLSRLEAIREEGAFAEVTNMNYDDTVRMCADLADEKGYVLIQDTAWEGYEEVPLSIMQGYAAIALELVKELESLKQHPPTHVFLQAGVGSFAAAVAAYLMNHYHLNPPQIVIFESDQADCYYKSFASKENERRVVSGDLNTIMAGLACGEPSTVAFNMLEQCSTGVFSCSDEIAALGMRIYASPIKNDPRIISGESGAGTLGLLYYLLNNDDGKLAEEIGLNAYSNVLLFNTEGDTDPRSFRDIVWQGKYPFSQ